MRSGGTLLPMPWTAASQSPVEGEAVGERGDPLELGDAEHPRLVGVHEAARRRGAADGVRDARPGQALEREALPVRPAPPRLAPAPGLEPRDPGQVALGLGDAVERLPERDGPPAGGRVGGLQAEVLAGADDDDPLAVLGDPEALGVEEARRGAVAAGLELAQHLGEDEAHPAAHEAGHVLEHEGPRAAGRAGGGRTPGTGRCAGRRAGACRPC